MQVRYEFKADLSHFATAFERYRRTRWFYRIGQAIKWIGLIVLLICWITVAIQRVWLPVATITVVMGLIWFGPFLDCYVLNRRLRRSPFLDVDCVLTLTDEGFQSQSTTHNSQGPWKMYTKAVRFADGWLLFYGPQMFIWLSDSTQVAGSTADTEQLFRQHVPLVILKP